MKPLPLAICLAGVAFLGAGRLGEPVVVWNTTASAPLGFYGIDRTSRARVGEWVFARPQGDLAIWLDRRGFLPRGGLLLKRIAAGPGDRLCWSRRELRINGQVELPLLPGDSRGAELPYPRGCRRLEAGRVLMAAPDTRSLDGRYFGATPAAWIVGRARPLWTWARR